MIVKGIAGRNDWEKRTVDIEIHRGDSVNYGNDGMVLVIEKLKPFSVIAHQNGKKWNIDISPKKWADIKALEYVLQEWNLKHHKEV